MNAPRVKSRAEAVLAPEDGDLLRRLGIAIRAHRIAGNWTWRTLADRLAIGESTIWRLEKGDPRISLGYYLATCRLLGIQLLDPLELSRQVEHLDLTRRRGSRDVGDEARFL